MRYRSLSLVVLVLVSVAAPTVVAAGAASANPSVDVTIRSTDIGEGDTYEAGTDVDLTIDASVGDAAADGTGLSDIVVRVNGDLAESIAVDGTNVTETVEPSLSNGENEIRVIVTDDAGAVDATAFTVEKDAEAPHVYLTSPYQTAPWKPIDDGTANGSRVTIAGNVIESTGVEKLRITREFGDDRSTRALRDVGENFSVEMLLGYAEGGNATNEFRLTATDEFGNVRIYDFEIAVADRRAPSVSTEPFPNETARNRVFLAGTVGDDVRVRSANLTLRGPDGNVTGESTIAAERSRALDSDRLSVPFNESLYTLYPGTYEATVSVTDATGKTTTRTVEIERVPRSERDVAPTIAVDRDRTVVLNDGRLFLAGTAFEGVTERLVVETRLAATGETLDYQVVHSGSRRQRVEFDREVAIADNRTTVIVRATDADGVEHTEEFAVDGAARETFVDESEPDAEGDGNETDWPTVGVESLQDGRTGTASSSVTVRRAAAGTTVTVPDNASRAVVATTNVSVERLRFDAAADTNLTATVVARERAGAALSGPDGATTAATVTVQHSVTDDAVDGVTYDLSVRRPYLDAHGLDPANLTVYRLSAGNWSAIGTSVAESDEAHVRYRVDSPGLSVFSLSTDPALADANGTDGNGTTANGTDGDGTAGNGTAADGTAGNGTASGDGEPSGEATIFVSNVTVNRTAVAVNESVAVNVTLANEGDADGTYTAGLQTLQGTNVSFVGTETVAVPAGERRGAQFTTNFSTTGNHTVMVNGTQAGPVVVGAGGGLLSFLSFLSVLPLRLIGMALGGLLGLGLVVVLLRFVLGKVGGGDSANG
ncbi:hypothetical protein HZS55_09680 [Halosimplex rubrum]|uniref:PGF-pre-PGF domain-containing protein n=1 Tax=Halosimplex rubrum TaxID=869889 RepID=A0A7D5SXZ7_9EURY|nr:hypothetical protein [Halosimplex rubrum]QLH77551.1 hypothetical protein HZS55_09680 [Halosimplex rubrum]